MWKIGNFGGMLHALPGGMSAARRKAQRPGLPIAANLAVDVTAVERV
ncbi:hypothetical protein [Burkholderia sp. SCN-KJ]|nr:hypothetical protein [Burkholderia sp. SCN-KJ]MCR4465498.1 hypothetical protein [Burkholderia sp. SCN-KJ]